MTPSQAHVFAVILVYNHGESACRVIRSVKAQSYPVARIIVVDNCSTDGSASQIAAEHPDIVLLRLPENRGVGGGHNEGWRMALGDPSCDFIWSLEHDCYPAPDCLDTLLQAYSTLFSPDVEDNPGMVVPVAEHATYVDAAQYIVISGLRIRPFVVLPRALPPQRIDGFTFNGLLISPKTILRVGLLDESFFFGGEHAEYAFRCKQQGILSYRVPDARVEHNFFHEHLQFKLGQYTFIIPRHTGPSRIYYGFRNNLDFLARRHSSRGWLYLRYLASYFLLQIWDLLFSDDRWRALQARTLALIDGIRGRRGRADYPCLTPKPHPLTHAKSKRATVT